MFCVVSDSGNQAAWSPLYGGGAAKLDSDTINYIHRIYCRECRMEEQRRQKMDMTAGTGAEAAGASGAPTPGAAQGGSQQPTSPQTVVEEISIQQNKDKNKECE